MLERPGRCQADCGTSGICSVESLSVDANSNLLMFVVLGVSGGNKIVKLRLAPNLAKLSKLNRINSRKSEAEMSESHAVLNENERGLSPKKVTFDQE